MSSRVWLANFPVSVHLVFWDKKCYSIKSKIMQILIHNALVKISYFCIHTWLVRHPDVSYAGRVGNCIRKLGQANSCVKLCIYNIKKSDPKFSLALVQIPYNFLVSEVKAGKLQQNVKTFDSCRNVFCISTASGKLPVKFKIFYHCFGWTDLEE